MAIQLRVHRMSTVHEQRPDLGEGPLVSVLGSQREIRRSLPVVHWPFSEQRWQALPPQHQTSNRVSLPCQQIANRAVVPISASSSVDTSIIQCLGQSAVGGRSSRLYLLDDGKDVSGEGVRCLLA